MQNNLTLIPSLSIHPQQINFYYERDWQPNKPVKNNSLSGFTKSQIKYQHLLKSSRTAQGNVSKVARRKLAKAIDYLLLMANDKYIGSHITGRAFKFKIAFITLTLPSAQKHSDNEIKRKCLASFLTEIERYHKVKNYVWRAELQKNGNIHFHILIDKFIHWNEVRNRWNRIINKLGYVTRYRENMKSFYKDGFKVRKDLVSHWSEKRQRASYLVNVQTDYHNPNSTDIHALHKIRNIKLYLVKYLSKNAEHAKDGESVEYNERIQQGRIWSSSKNLQNIKGCQTQLDSELESEITQICDKAGIVGYHADYFSIFNVSISQVLEHGGERLYNLFARYILNTFNYSLARPLFT